MNTYLYHIVSAENRDKESLINEDRIVNEGKGLMMSIARADRIDDAKEQTEAVLYLDDNSSMGGMIHISPINNLLTIDKSFGIKAYQHYLRVLHDGLSYAVQNMMDKYVFILLILFFICYLYFKKFISQHLVHRMYICGISNLYIKPHQYV